MPLSDEERRRLRELEALLSAQDPFLARNLQEGKPRSPVRRGTVLAVVAVLAGLALVMVGVSTQMMLVGVAGFALECIAAYWFLPRQDSHHQPPLFPRHSSGPTQ